MLIEYRNKIINTDRVERIDINKYPMANPTETEICFHFVSDNFISFQFKNEDHFKQFKATFEAHIQSSYKYAIIEDVEGVNKNG